VNSYTYRQAMSLVNYIVRDKFAVVSELLKSFNPSIKPSMSSTHPSPQAGGRLPSWYKPRSNARIRVVDLDGPIEGLTPFLGKGKVRRGKAL
jgi:hypothetical protein